MEEVLHGRGCKGNRLYMGVVSGNGFIWEGL